MSTVEEKYGQEGLASLFPSGMRPFTAGDELIDHVGARVDDVDGKKVGTVHAVLVARADGRRRFLLVRGRSGQRGVPCEGALVGGGRVWVPYPKDLIDRGPPLSAHGAVGARAEKALCDLFGIDAGPSGRAAAWERRATLSRATRDAADRRTVTWTPGPRVPPA